MKPNQKSETLRLRTTQYRGNITTGIIEVEPRYHPFKNPIVLKIRTDIIELII